MSRIYKTFLTLLLVGLSAHSEETSNFSDILKLKGCVLTKNSKYKTINCTVPLDQNVFIKDGYLPRGTMVVTINGGDTVQFEENSLSHLSDLKSIAIQGAKSVLMKKHASIEQNPTSLDINIADTYLFQMESNTFSKLRGPLTMSVKNCQLVTFGKEAFSWLLALHVQNVGQLQLVSGTFALDPTAENIGMHGPGMTVELLNLNISEIPSQAFGSSAALVRMEAVNVQTVKMGAFSANTYNIVLAINTTLTYIEKKAFAPYSLINNFQLHNCRLHHFSSNALRSAIGTLKLSHNRFDKVGTGAINGTVASVKLEGNRFKIFDEKGFIFSSCNKYYIDRNSFDELPPYSIIAPGSTPHELTFINNEIETINEESLPFIGQAFAALPNKVHYANNYFGHSCHCNFTKFLRKAMISKYERVIETESYCTVDEIFARCFNVPEQNIRLSQFMIRVCSDDKNDIKCEAYRSKKEGKIVEIKNPRFPHKHENDGGLSDRDKKVIGIVIVSALGCVVIVLFISLIRCMRRRGHCASVKNILLSCNSSCGSICGLNNGIDNARSISQLSVHEYSERHRLNEPRIHEMVQEIALPNYYSEELVRVDDKTTQTMPEELTKELLENLKERLDNPENYDEAREMIEHLYELINAEESLSENAARPQIVEENIYELPYQHTVPRIGRNKRRMISIGTKVPSLDKLLPLSPYNRQTALAHEYFQPKDFAVHLYAEIANCNRDRARLGVIPDVLAEQPVPRGPYLRAVHDKINAGPSAPGPSAPGPSTRPAIAVISNPQHMSTIKSNKSTTSNSSAKMLNRPLPEKPDEIQDPGEGTSRG